MSIDAILPAAGRISGEFAAEAGADVKALIEIGGRTVLERTLSTLRASGRIGRIVVIGPEAVSMHPASQMADAVLSEGGDSGPANIVRGIEWLQEANGGNHAEKVLVVTTDLPFLTPGCIDGYLDSCPDGVDVCAPLVDRQSYEARFPTSEIVYVNLRDGQWTMGCAFLVDPQAVIANRTTIEQVFQARKSQMKMARLLGLGFIARFVTGRLEVGHIESRCRQILGCSACAVRGSAPELAFDIDGIEDYRWASKFAAAGTEVQS